MQLRLANQPFRWVAYTRSAERKPFFVRSTPFFQMLSGGCSRAPPCFSFLALSKATQAFVPLSFLIFGRKERNGDLSFLFFPIFTKSWSFRLTYGIAFVRYICDLQALCRQLATALPIEMSFLECCCWTRRAWHEVHVVLSQNGMHFM